MPIIAFNSINIPLFDFIHSNAIGFEYLISFSPMMDEKLVEMIILFAYLVHILNTVG